MALAKIMSFINPILLASPQHGPSTCWLPLFPVNCAITISITWVPFHSIMLAVPITPQAPAHVLSYIFIPTSFFFFHPCHFYPANSCPAIKSPLPISTPSHSFLWGQQKSIIPWCVSPLTFYPLKLFPYITGIFNRSHLLGNRKFF